MVRGGTGLDAHQARWQLPKERQHVTALQLPPDDRLFSGINAVDLEY
jgi:hypothetical protein